MLGVPYDNIFVKFGEHFFQQIICIPNENKLPLSLSIFSFPKTY
jgi:hypothetical protein